MGAIILNGAKIGANSSGRRGRADHRGQGVPRQFGDRRGAGQTRARGRRQDEGNDGARGRRLCAPLEAICGGADAARMTLGTWQFCIDRGGTFTDIVARAPDGRSSRTSSSRKTPRPMRCGDRRHRRSAWRLRAGAPLPPELIAQRQDGHHGRHQCAARAQGRPRAAARDRRFPRRARDRLSGAAEDLRAQIEKPSMLYARVAEVPRARARRRQVETPLDLDAMRAALEAAPRRRHRRRRHRVHACLCASRRMSAQARALAREMGFTQVSVSHEVSPLVKFVGRGDTTVVDAYLSPLLRRYVEQVAATGSALRKPLPPAGRGARREARARGTTKCASPHPDPSPARGEGRSAPRLIFMHVLGRADLGASVPRQGRHPVRPGRRRGRRGRDGADWQALTASSASTWAAPRPMSAISTACMSAPSRAWSRACACARR